MTLQDITLSLPSNLYQRLREMAEASQKPLNEVLIQSLQMGLPPSLNQVPERFRQDLSTLNQLRDDVLTEVAQSDLSLDKAKLYETLLLEQQQRDLAETEQQTLHTLREEADLLMLRRAYAVALLKWRGHHLPSPINQQNL